MPAGTTWTHPTGGFYVWTTLPEGLDAKVMQPRAITARVAYVPGIGFYADGQGARELRLSYCFPEPDRIREGVRRLAARRRGRARAAAAPSARRTPRRSAAAVQTPAPDMA